MTHTSLVVPREGNIVGLAAPFEPLVKAICFTRIPAGDCTNPAFRQHCTRTFSHGDTTVVVGQNSDGQLTLAFGSQPTYKLRRYESRTFVIDELEGFQVEFHLGPDGNRMNCSSISRMEHSPLDERSLRRSVAR